MRFVDSVGTVHIGLKCDMALAVDKLDKRTRPKERTAGIVAANQAAP